MKKIVAAMICLGLLIANPVSSKEGVTPMLKMKTTYHFMWFDPMVPAAPFAGRPPGVQWAYAWEGTIEGDVNGVVRWWVEFPLTGVGRWELWDCEPVYPSPGCDFDNSALLIMAGYDAFGYVSETDWEGKGVVTYAREDYVEWFGRRITDGGWVEFDAATGFPVYGEGPFVIYNRPSNKH